MKKSSCKVKTITKKEPQVTRINSLEEHLNNLADIIIERMVEEQVKKTTI